MENQLAASDDVDARTVFIRDLPFSLTDEQLEEVFSEVGPVRHCFTVKDKGSKQNRGFGFVQYALCEDATRAVEAKNGIPLQGRKIKVELAKRRAPLDQRRPPKPKDVQMEKDVKPLENLPESATEQDSKMLKKKRKGTELEETVVEGSKDTFKQKNKKLKLEISISPPLKLPRKAKEPREVGKSSDKQRPARTVVVGGLSSPEMKAAVVSQVKKLESIESDPTSMTEHELSSCGLAKDGCKPNAISIVLSSVRGARKVVAALHRQKIGGGLVWARQLGGEGSKLKRWRLIVRNLPFTVKEDVLRDLFAPAGFVWEVTIPCKQDGNARGFAFVGFTSKSDAEKAIETLNMKTVEKRPIAVDWAVAKKNYETIVQVGGPAESSNGKKEHEKGTAKELNDVDEGTASEDEQEVVVRADGGRKQKRFREVLAGDLEAKLVTADNKIRTTDLDQSFEMDLVRKVMDKIVSSNADEAAPADHVNILEEQKDESLAEQAEQERADKRGDALTRTVFVRNLPLEIKIPEMKKLFSVFGEVQTFRLVYVKKSKNPKGSGFLEFATADAATAAVAASKGGQEEWIGGIEVKGQILVLTMAVDRDAVKNAIKPDTPHANGVDSIDRTVFIRNLPTDVNALEMQETFSLFGEVKSARLVLHPITKRPKGTAFLEFGSVEAAKAAESAAKSIGPDGTGGIKLAGRAVKVDIAVGQQAARDIATKLSKEETGDRRNRHLAQEGVIVEGTPAAEGLSKADIQKRKELMHEKATKLRSPNFHVSRTRLAVHNVPKTTSETDLKRMFLEAVLARASKQKPVIKQVKILKDVTKAGGAKSRGTAFVEFTEHQHALVALRVLNNHPDIFGSEHRPIVEFSIENMKILEKRAKREAAAKNRSINEGGEQMQPQRKEHKKGIAEGDGKTEEGIRHKDTGTVRALGKKRKRAAQKLEKSEGERKIEEMNQKPATKRKKLPAPGLAVGQQGSKDREEDFGMQGGGPQGKGKKKRRASVADNGREPAGNKVLFARKAGRVAKEDHVARPSTGRNIEEIGLRSLSQDPAGKQLSRRGRKQLKQGLKPGEDRVDQLVRVYRRKYLSDVPGQKRPDGETGKFVDDMRRWYE